jgi:hypothetical protein
MLLLLTFAILLLGCELFAQLVDSISPGVFVMVQVEMEIPVCGVS